MLWALIQIHFSRLFPVPRLHTIHYYSHSKSHYTQGLSKRGDTWLELGLQRQGWGVNTTTQFTKIHLSINWNTCFTHQHLTKTETGNLTIQGNYDQKPTENSKLRPEVTAPLSKVFHSWLPASQTGRKVSSAADLPNQTHTTYMFLLENTANFYSFPKL